MSELERNKREEMVVAVTGAANYLGIGVMKRLVRQTKTPIRIIALDIRKPEFEHPNVTYHRIDLTNPSASQILARIFQNEGVKRLAHLIFSYTLSRDRSLAHELEAIGTMHVLDACDEAGVERVAARSTTTIYGARRGNPNFLTEIHETGQMNADALFHDKIELERQMQQYQRNHPECAVAILRECSSLGATSMNYISSLISQKRPPKVLGFDPLMQFIHEEDLFRAHEMAILGEHRGIFNIVGKGVVRYSEAIEAMGGRAKTRPETMLRATTSLFWALKLNNTPGGLLDYIKYSWVADGTHAANVLGFVPQFDCFEAIEAAKLMKRQRAA